MAMPCGKSQIMRLTYDGFRFNHADDHKARVLTFKKNVIEEQREELAKLIEQATSNSNGLAV